MNEVEGMNNSREMKEKSILLLLENGRKVLESIKKMLLLVQKIF